MFFFVRKTRYMSICVRPSVSLQENNGAGRGGWVRILTPGRAPASWGEGQRRKLLPGGAQNPVPRPVQGPTDLLSPPLLSLALPPSSRSLETPPSPGEGRWERELSLANSSAVASIPQLPGTAPRFWKGPTPFFFF